MKRYRNLYKNICDMNNILLAYNEVLKNTNNKTRVCKLRDYKSLYVYRICNTLTHRKYKVGPYNEFTIYEPKERHIVSQNLEDKIINHLVARFILYPAILPCLLDVNVASRKNMGTNKGLKISYTYQNKCNIKYRDYYVLKCDISKFFASIDHDILKNKIIKRIKDKDALKIVFDIINSNTEGLYIGSMTNQILAIFYLNDMDHFIKEKLKIKYYVRYQDDFLLFHESKEYLRYCLQEIKNFLEKEKLQLNSKTRIYKNINNFLFLGRNIKGIYSRYRNIKRKIKKKFKLYTQDKLSLNSYISTIICYKSLCSRKNIIKK